MRGSVSLANHGLLEFRLVRGLGGQVTGRLAVNVFAVGIAPSGNVRHLITEWTTFEDHQMPLTWK